MRPVLTFSLLATLGMGVVAPVVTAEPSLTVSFKTSQVGGTYAPANVVAVWIQDAQGTFIKTIGRWADIRKNHLVLWQAKAGLNDVDAVSGATRANHADTLMVTWDVKDKLGALVPDGVYTIKMELADSDTVASGQNNQGVFTFTKGPTIDMQTIAGAPNVNGGFINVNIKYDPNANACNNNVVDPGETCDPPGSCPVTCAPSGDACAPNELTGSAVTCTAACTTRTITACVAGDGCCAAGCTAATDSDCAGEDNNVNGGCSTGTGGGEGVMVFGVLALFTMVRRARPRAA